MVSSRKDKENSQEGKLKTQGRRLAELGQFVGGFAHEIRNPLSTIGLNLKMIEEELKEPMSPRERRVQRRLGRLSREVERLQDILEGFLSYVRAPGPARRKTNLNDIVRDLSDLVGPGLELAGHNLRVFYKPELPDIQVDPSQIQQVVLNLVTNAEQALQEEGRTGEILLATDRRREKGRRVQVITVTDSGPGMEEEVLEKCFQPYFSTKSGGSGLGLAVTQRLIHDHGGEVRVESHPGHGTRFEVILPEELEDPEELADREEPEERKESEKEAEGGT
ncbi:MAG TPA: two-component sensor histidine kinase [Planctomycetes bacterium]|nr:two-component sensor histidine kinase [Planctomycetota bacterium]